MKLNLDPPRARFRIRNRRTGTYLHLTLFRILEFFTRTEAICYMNRCNLNRNIYYTEAVL